MTGWPKSRKSVPPHVQSLWNITDELHVAEGITFVGERVLIPATLRRPMLRLIHESHMGAEKCKARARTVMFGLACQRTSKTKSSNVQCAQNIRKASNESL